MKHSKINLEIDRLDLDWQEYDFGDTMYAKIPIELLFSETNIFEDCDTQKYKIRFTVHDYVLVFTEQQKPLLASKIKSALLKGYSQFKRQLLSSRALR